MPYKSMWVYYKDFAQKSKSSFIARKKSFFEPTSTGKPRKKPHRYW